MGVMNTGMDSKSTSEPKKKGRIVLLVVILILAVVIAVLAKHIWDVRQANKGTAGERDQFKALIAENPEVIAWLTVDDTGIDTAVTQAEDNIKYLNTDVHGEESLAGNPFLDYRNSSDFSDVYSIIYGHHIEDGLMFTDLELFTDPAFWDQERTGTLWLADGSRYRIQFCACLIVNEDDSRYFDPVRVRNNWNEDFLTDLTTDAIVNQKPLKTDDHILTLSTCEAADSDKRIIIIGKMDKE